MNNVLWKLDRVILNGTPEPRLEDLSLEISRGITAVVGHSGAGKTSLLNLLVGFEQPDRGSVLSELPAESGRLPLFWVPQNDGLWPHLSGTFESGYGGCVVSALERIEPFAHGNCESSFALA